MKRRSTLIPFLFCFALCLTAAVSLYAENLLDVVEAAQNTIQTKYPDKDSIARKLALEELEKLARSDKTDEEKIKVILEKYPASSVGLSDKTDLNANGIPDEWEKKFKISPGFTAPESDEDADGFNLLEEYKADTDPTDPLSHPKYITRIYISAVSRQRLTGLELVSVAENISSAAAVFNVLRDGRERIEYVHIGNDSDTFNYSNTSFRAVLLAYERSPNNPYRKTPVVYIRRVGRDVLIPCRLREPIYDTVLQVKSLDSLNGRTITSSVGGTFKLGSEKTGEETYRIVSADPETKITVVESVGEKPETFKIPPVPKKLSAPSSQKSAKEGEK